MESAEQKLQQALAHHRAGRLDEAVSMYRQIIAQHPDNVAAYQFLAAIAAHRGQFPSAVSLMEQAVGTAPNSPEPLANLCALYVSQKDFQKAIDAGRRAVALNPEYLEGRYNLGLALQENSRHDEALLELALVAARRPNWPELHNAIGASLKARGDIDAAIASFRRALTLKPDNALTHWNLALALLLQGNFTEGWREFEWRTKDPTIVPPRNFRQPKWDGGDLRGKTILVHDEQGFGDTLQFVRYLPMVVARGGRVILGCERETSRLLQSAPGVDRTVSFGQPLPDFDVHVPLLSLPLIFGTTLQTIPAAVPYLKAPPDSAEQWRQRLGPADGRLRVGLAWAGRPTHKNDVRRSTRLDQFAPLAEMKSIAFHSLQKGEAARQSATPPAGMQLVDRTAELHDFADTAGLIANLDLVISVDTAVAHLAGAMGKPVWVLLPFAPDWRWLLNREDCPWYPTMRLFRQSAEGDWTGVISRVGSALSQFPASR